MDRLNYIDDLAALGQTTIVVLLLLLTLYVVGIRPLLITHKENRHGKERN